LNKRTEEFVVDLFDYICKNKKGIKMKKEKITEYLQKGRVIVNKLNEMKEDDAAFSSLVLGLTSIALVSSSGCYSPLSTVGAISGAAAVKLGYNGKNSKFGKTAIWGSVLGTISVVEWTLAHYYRNR
jgi:hypothetical protein